MLHLQDRVQGWFLKVKNASIWLYAWIPKTVKMLPILRIFWFHTFWKSDSAVSACKSGSENGPNQIQRENAQRRIVVGFNIKDRDVQSIVEELQGKVDQKMKLPTGYYMTYGGSFENLNNAKQRLMIAVPIALALIFVMLFFAFKSVKKAYLFILQFHFPSLEEYFSGSERNAFQYQCRSRVYCTFGVAVLNGIVLI
jgi:cobalt-zinc-cadmium resistance protein CzcA